MTTICKVAKSLAKVSPGPQKKKAGRGPPDREGIRVGGGVECINLTLIPQDLIHKTCNYRVPVFNCNFGNDLQLYTNYRVITSNMLAAALSAAWSRVHHPSQCLWGSDKGRVLGTSSFGL